MSLVKDRESIIMAFDTFVQGYKERKMDTLDEFMDVFSDSEDAQMMGIGATVPGAYEWFCGKDEIKEIIESDWTYWGNVHFDMDTLRLSQIGEVAWFSLCATLEQIDSSEETWGFFVNQMKDLLEKDDQSNHDKIFEAAHFGIRRVREKNLGVGYPWKMVITGTLVNEEKWRFHTLHWSMPVD